MSLINLGNKKFDGPRCFVQVGEYKGRNSLTKTTFRVVNGVTLPQLKAAIESAVNSLVPKV